MSELRPFALVRDGDQWVRGAFDRTFLEYESGVVELAWTTKTLESSSHAPSSIGAGLAFDNECRLYHSAAGRRDGGPRAVGCARRVGARAATTRRR